MSKDKYSKCYETNLIHGGSARSQFWETSEAIYMNSGFTYESAEQAAARFSGDEPGFVYSRYANPTVNMFEERLRLLEGAEAIRTTSSGMAAVFLALGSFLKAGDHLVAARALFGSCLYIAETVLPRFGVETTIIDGCDLTAWKEAIKPNTRAFFFETPTNPTLEIIDIAAVAEIAQKHNIEVVVDNVFATPLYQSPLELGATVVTYSATKHIDGQGRALGGAVLARQEFIDEYVHDFHRHTGPSLSPFNAWTLLKGMETLNLRVDKATENAAQLADLLSNQKKINHIRYPHHKSHPHYDIAKKQMKKGSTLLAFEVEGGQKAAFNLANRLETILISNNLGDAKSLITHPTTTTHRSLTEEQRLNLGITPGILRLSVGCEAIEDLEKDLLNALS